MNLKTDVEDVKGINESLARWGGFRGQSEPWMLKGMGVEVKGLFESIFVGVKMERGEWARRPGSWWGHRKRVVEGGRGRRFVEDMAEKAVEIKKKLGIWECEMREVLGGKRGQKRKVSAALWKMLEENEGRRPKRSKRNERQAEEVMSEKWRARRREQEKRAGRWTDGTLRMDRLWEQFHWVLNSEDPMETKWERVSKSRGVREVSGNDIWSKGRRVFAKG